MTERAHSKAVVFKGDDGARRMLLVTSNAYKDREGEYISSEALADYVNEQWEGQQFKGDNVLLFWHQGPAIGDIEYAGLHDGFLVEVAKERASGLPLVSFYTKAIWDYIANEPPETWGASHGFGFTDKDREAGPDGPVYRRIRKFETSCLPLEYAANRLTFSGVIPMTEARDKKLDEIQPGLTDRIKRALGLVKSDLDAAGVEHKSIDASMTRTDLEDVLVAVTQQVLANAEALVSKAVDDDEEPQALDLHTVVKDTLDSFMEVPTVDLETAEAILAVDEPAAETEADADEPEQHEHHEPVEEAESDKALTATLALNDQLIDDLAQTTKAQAEIVEALRGLGELPGVIQALTERVKQMEQQFEQRPRASRATETVADGALAEMVEKAINDNDWDNFVPRVHK